MLISDWSSDVCSSDLLTAAYALLTPGLTVAGANTLTTNPCNKKCPRARVSLILTSHFPGFAWWNKRENGGHRSLRGGVPAVHGGSGTGAALCAKIMKKFAC